MSPGKGTTRNRKDIGRRLRAPSRKSDYIEFTALWGMQPCRYRWLKSLLVPLFYLSYGRKMWGFPAKYRTLPPWEEPTVFLYVTALMLPT